MTNSNKTTQSSFVTVFFFPHDILFFTCSTVSFVIIHQLVCPSKHKKWSYHEERLTFHRPWLGSIQFPRLPPVPYSGTSNKNIDALLLNVYSLFKKNVTKRCASELDYCKRMFIHKQYSQQSFHNVHTPGIQVDNR